MTGLRSRSRCCPVKTPTQRNRRQQTSPTSIRVFAAVFWWDGSTIRRGVELVWLGSRVVDMLDSGAVGPGFSQVTVLGTLFTPSMPLFTKQRNW